MSSPTYNALPEHNVLMFPSETIFRFILLIVSVVGSVLFLFENLYTNIHIQALIDQSDCPAPKIAADALISYDAEAYDLILKSIETWRACNAPYQLQKALWIFGSIGALLLVSGVIYWLLPVWQIRRMRLLPIETANHPELASYLSRLCLEINLAPPRFFWKPLCGRNGGHTFGHFRQSYVCLDGGLLQQFDDDRALFRAIVLHELAHLRNADIGVTLFSVAISLAAILVAFIPYAFSLLALHNDLSSVVFLLNMSWRGALLLLLVYLSLASVLRTREFYADIRAATWDGSATGLAHALTEHSDKPEMERWWRRIWRMHPTTRDRLAVLSNPYALLHVGVGEALLTGTAASVAINNIVDVLTTTASGLHAEINTLLIASLLFAALIVAIIGTGLWRAAFATLQQARTPLRSIKLALGLGIGVLIGQLITFHSISMQIGVVDLTPNYLLVQSMSLILLCIGLFVFLSWIESTARTWLVISPTRLPKRAYAFGLCLATSILTVGIAVVYQLGQLGEGSAIGLLDPIAIIWLQMPKLPLLLALLSLWVFPLAAEWCRLSANIPTSQPHESLYRQIRIMAGRICRLLNLPVILIHGMIAGAIMAILWVNLRLDLHRELPHIDVPFESVLLRVLEWQSSHAALLQVLVAILVAMSVPRLRVAQALIAALFACVCLVLGAETINQLAGCFPAIALRAGVDCTIQVDLSFQVFSFLTFAPLGAVLSTPAAIAAAALAKRLPLVAHYSLRASIGFLMTWVIWNGAESFLPQALVSQASDAVFIMLCTCAQLYGMIAVAHAAQERKGRNNFAAMIIITSISIVGYIGINSILLVSLFRIVNDIGLRTASLNISLVVLTIGMCLALLVSALTRAVIYGRRRLFGMQ